MNRDGREAVRVECYAGYRGEETPRRVLSRSGVTQVVDILERWRTPDHRCFLILVENGRRYLLRHNLISETWDMRPGRKVSDPHE